MRTDDNGNNIYHRPSIHNVIIKYLNFRKSNVSEKAGKLAGVHVKTSANQIPVNVFLMILVWK